MSEMTAPPRPARPSVAEPVAFRQALAWLLPLAGLVTLIGYFGPWIDHAAAGLVVTGLDLAEYVKFLPGVRTGALSVWREGFYLPLVTVSLAWSLSAFRPELGYGWPVRSLLLLGAAIAALNLLPPAWTPGLLRTPEFRGQAAVMLICLGIVLVSPFAALLPRRLTGATIALLAAWSLWTPVRSFLIILSEIVLVYNVAQQPAWGMYVMMVGLVGLLMVGLLFMLLRSTKSI
jgi:hypothetical protein